MSEADVNVKKTILIIDDMAAILEHARQLLKEEYKVIPCLGAAQAFDVMNKIKPDLILVDINMPDIDGYEFTGRVKGDDNLKNIPVLMVTAEITADIETKGFEYGADDFVLKPFTQSILLRKLRNHIA